MKLYYIGVLKCVPNPLQIMLTTQRDGGSINTPSVPAGSLRLDKGLGTHIKTLIKYSSINNFIIPFLLNRNLMFKLLFKINFFKKNKSRNFAL